MQLDRTRITIRERTTFELFDLALQVVRTFVAPLCGWLLLGALPWALLNHWLLAGNPNLEEITDLKFWNTWWVLWLVILEIPLATAPATLYLGQVLFLETPTRSQILRNMASSLPQMLLLQGWPLALLVVSMLLGASPLAGVVLVIVIMPLAFFRFGFRPYLAEIILLERNPLRSKDASRISTRRRSKALHSWSRGELFERFMASILVGVCLVAQLTFVIWGAKTFISGNADLSLPVYMTIIQISLWIVVGFFAVVRFLCYLDLRIRREGWEVDLRMRAEAARIAQELF